LCGAAALLIWLLKPWVMRLTYGALDTRSPPG
jgi:hypothetical protein